MLTYFSFPRNPTPKKDEIIDTIWPKYTKDEESFLSIDSKLSVKHHQNRLKVWHDFQKRFTGHM
jgi:hypothetical protein